MELTEKEIGLVCAWGLVIQKDSGLTEEETELIEKLIKGHGIPSRWK